MSFRVIGSTRVEIDIAAAGRIAKVYASSRRFLPHEVLLCALGTIGGSHHRPAMDSSVILPTNTGTRSPQMYLTTLAVASVRVIRAGIEVVETVNLTNRTLMWHHYPTHLTLDS